MNKTCNFYGFNDKECRQAFDGKELFYKGLKRYKDYGIYLNSHIDINCVNANAHSSGTNISKVVRGRKKGGLIDVSQYRKYQTGIFSCGICGTEKIYRYVHQMRKFDVYSCQPCRMFITKLKSLVLEQCTEDLESFKLKCKSKTYPGNCIIRLSRKDKQSYIITGRRCKACWLVLCLRIYNLSSSLKSSLFKLLPNNMEGIDLSKLPPSEASYPIIIKENDYNNVRQLNGCTVKKRWHKSKKLFYNGNNCHGSIGTNNSLRNRPSHDVIHETEPKKKVLILRIIRKIIKI